MQFRHRNVHVLTAGFLTLALFTPCVNADDVTTTAGKKLNGKLIGVDTQGVTFRTTDGDVQIPARDIVIVDLGSKAVVQPKDATPYSEIELTDGSTIRAAKYTLSGKKFEAELIAGAAGAARPQFDLPMSAVFSAMKKADDLKQREYWRKMLATRGKRDLYVIQQEAGLTFIQGTILGGGANAAGSAIVSFEKEGGGKDELLMSRAAGLVFAQPQPAAIVATLCKVSDVFGNSLTAAAIALAPDGSIAITTVAGATAKYASTSAIVKLDYAQGNIAYLSDLDAQVTMAEVPPEELRLNPTTPLLKDRSLSNETIKLESQLFAKGLCIAPDTTATFNLGGDYTQFKATVGIDENGANATSAARVTIEADGQVLFSEPIRRKEKPKGLVLAVKGVKQLRIIVEADTPLNGNYVTLADARVQK